MSMIRARVRLGKRANGTSMTTASPVITSATRLPCLSRLSVSRLPGVDVDAFVAAHQADWARLDELARRRRRRLTGDEIDELVALYQRTTTHLSVLRSAGHDPALAARLSSRVAQARTTVTGSHVPAWSAVGRFARGVVPGHGVPGPLVVGGLRGRLPPGRGPAGLVGGPLAWRAGRAAARHPGPPAGEPPVPWLLLAVRGELVRREGVDQQRVGRRRGAHLRGAARPAHAGGAVRERRQRRGGRRPDGRARPGRASSSR